MGLGKRLDLIDWGFVMYYVANETPMNTDDDQACEIEDVRKVLDLR